MITKCRQQASATSRSGRCRQRTAHHCSFHQWQLGTGACGAALHTLGGSYPGCTQRAVSVRAAGTHHIDDRQDYTQTATCQNPVTKHHSYTKNRPLNSSSSSSRHGKHSLAELEQLLRCRPAVEHGALLTAAIKATSSWQQAALLFTEHSDSFNHVHTAALISHLGKLLAGCARPLARQEAADVRLLLRDVSQLAEEVLPHCSGRELANMAHGFAAAGSYSRRLMQLLLGRCNLAALKPQELANLTWAVAKLNHEMHEGWTAEVLALSYQYMQNPSPRTPQGHIRTRDQVIGFKPQEMCNVAWALAVMQRRCLLCSAPPLRHSCTRVDAAWKVQFRQAAAAQLWDFQAADLAMGLWALAVLGASDAEATWLDGQLQRAVQLVGHMQGRHVAVLLWSVSQVQRQQQQQHDRQRCNPRASTAAGNTSLLARHRDSGLQQFSSACFAQLPRLLQSERQQLQLACVVLLSAAHLQLHPPASTVHMLLRAAAGQLRQRSSSSWQDMQQRQQAAMASSTITGGVGWLADQHQHQQQQQQRSVQLVDVTALLYACARLQYHPSQQFMAAAAHAAATACWQLLQHKKHKKQQRQLGQQQQQQPPPPAVHMKEVALLLWAMGKLHYQPPRPLLRLLCKATAAVLTRCTSADVGLLLWSLARLRARPRHKLVQELLAHFIVRLDDGISTAADVCNVVHALPHLPGGRNLNPMLLDRLTASGQLQQLAAAAQARFRECGPRELVGIIQGFARLGFRPGSEWMAEHELCCSRLGADRLTDREKQALTAARAALAQLPDHQLPHVAQQPPQHLQQQQLLQQQRQRVEALAGAATLV